MMRNIVLIGLPGSGKTSLGAKAAEILNLDFLDLDHEIERQTGLSIPEIFSRFGEERFRALETEALLKSVSSKGRLIAGGGGVILRDLNASALKREGCVIFLDRPVEKIITGLTDDGSRPLLNGDPARLRQLSRERRDRYLAAADFSLPNQGGEEEGLNRLLAIIRAEITSDGYAVIGDPIVHSLSPTIHGAVFKSLGLNLPYRSFHVPPERLAAFTGRVRRSDIKGFNVTIPHKQTIMPMLDEIDEEAALCGAVNTVAHFNGRLTGFNTDMDGLRSALKDHGSDFFGRNVLILGAGGSAGSIAFKAARSGAEKVTILARRVEQAEEAAGRSRHYSKSKIHTGSLNPETMAAETGGADLLINCTPLGMRGFSDFQSFGFLDNLPSKAVVCDLIYLPARTNLLLEAEKRGLTVLNGLGMLIHQAILADERYLNQTLEKNRLYQIVAKALNEPA